MAKYTSRFKELSFYVGNETKRFSNGVYETGEKAEQGVLDGLADVKRLDEPKAEAKPTAPAKAKSANKPSAK